MPVFSKRYFRYMIFHLYFVLNLFIVVDINVSSGSGFVFLEAVLLGGLNKRYGPVSRHLYNLGGNVSANRRIMKNVSS